MGKKVHIDQVRAFAKTTPVFTTRDIELLVDDRAYSRLMLHQMSRRGELHRVARGFYSTYDDPVVSVFALRPAYLGLQDALSLRGLWEQETNVVIITSGKAKPGLRQVMGSRVVVHRLHPRYIFGFESIPYGDRFHVPVSDLEKTLIDLVYFRETPGMDVLKRLARKADRGKLERYLDRYDPLFAGRLRRLLLL